MSTKKPRARREVLALLDQLDRQLGPVDAATRDAIDREAKMIFDRR